ncbi:transcription intermediary factor 1-beta-like isoform X3 [Polyodon spathula]|uniref:transcription intermediary factor 1-beta-like isoform X3 n=1 Tax=Polyodon spathula TaxID=7913 RepID=UPI001B7E8582|nr:transcription intermediary factor 1-beta-like isoform X3 [Polyodon spathula]
MAATSTSSSKASGSSSGRASAWRDALSGAAAGAPPVPSPPVVDGAGAAAGAPPVPSPPVVDGAGAAAGAPPVPSPPVVDGAGAAAGAPPVPSPPVVDGAGAAAGAPPVPSPPVVDAGREALLESCGACRTRLRPDREPLLLPCLHSVCRACLPGGSADRCLICREQFCLKEVVENYFIRESPSGSKDSGGSKVCQCCEDSVLACGFCVQCSEWLCDPCVGAHQRVKLTKDHTVRTRSEGSGFERVFCSAHRQEPLQLYCITCDLLTCRDCQLHFHKNHRHQFVEDAIPSQRLLLETLIAQLQERASRVTKAERRVRDKARDLMEVERRVRVEIKMAVQQLIRDLSKRSGVLIQELQKRTEMHQQSLQQQHSDLVKLQNRQEQVLRFGAWALSKENSTALLHCRRTIFSQFQRALETAVKDEDSAALDIRFHWDARAWTGKISQFGRLSSDCSPPPPPPYRAPASPSRNRPLRFHYLQPHTPPPRAPPPGNESPPPRPQNCSGPDQTAPPAGRSKGGGLSGPVNGKAVRSGPVSAPGPPLPVSAPGPPLPVSAPGPPLPVSAPGPPLPVSAPGPPLPVSAPGPPLPVSAPGPPLPVNAPGPPLPVSAPGPPLPVNAPGPPLPVNAPGPPVPVNSPDPPLPVNAPGPPLPVNAPGPPLPVNAPGPPLPVNAPGPPLPVSAPGPPLPVSAPGPPLPVSAPGPPLPVNAPGPTLPVNATDPPLPVKYLVFQQLPVLQGYTVQQGLVGNGTFQTYFQLLPQTAANQQPAPPNPASSSPLQQVCTSASPNQPPGRQGAPVSQQWSRGLPSTFKEILTGVPPGAREQSSSVISEAPRNGTPKSNPVPPPAALTSPAPSSKAAANLAPAAARGSVEQAPPPGSRTEADAGVGHGLVNRMVPVVQLTRLVLDWEPGCKPPRFRVLSGGRERRDALVQLQPGSRTEDSPCVSVPDSTSPPSDCEGECSSSSSISSVPPASSLQRPSPASQPRGGREERPRVEGSMRCTSCRTWGQLALCCECGRGFHAQCHVPPLLRLLSAQWKCMLCRDFSEAGDQYKCEFSPKSETPGLSLLDQKKCEHLLLTLYCHKASGVFYKPPPVPDLGSYVDLTLIRGRLLRKLSPSYRRPEEFVGDLWLLLSNVLKHAKKSRITRSVVVLRASFSEKLKDTFGDSLDPRYLEPEISLSIPGKRGTGERPQSENEESQSKRTRLEHAEETTLESSSLRDQE